MIHPIGLPAIHWLRLVQLTVLLHLPGQKKYRFNISTLFLLQSIKRCTSIVVKMNMILLLYGLVTVLPTWQNCRNWSLSRAI